MFKIAEKRVLEWPVIIPVPQSGGKVRKQEALVEFEHLDQDEFDAIYANGGNDNDLVLRVTRNWREGQFQDEHGQDLPFSDESLTRLMKISYVRNAFVSAYIGLTQGREAARKN